MLYPKEKTLMGPLWNPSSSKIQQANLTAFIDTVNNRYRMQLAHFHDLHQWSIQELECFWQSVWDICGLITSEKGKRKIEISGGMFKARFFEDTQLNYAENLLRPRASETPAIVFWGEDKIKQTLSYGELYAQVARFAAYLKSIGVKKGDRVAAMVPNTPEAVIGMLATASLGAIWSSCSPDFGVSLSSLQEKPS